MADDIVTQLQRLSTTLERGEGRSTVLGAAVEIERLRRWKAEATAVIEDWDAVWEAAGRPGVLGRPKSLGLLGELGRIDNEIERLRDELAAWQATVRAHDALAAERADEIERLRANNAGLRFRLADLQRAIDHDPATCGLLVCNRCDPWEARRG